MHKKPLQITHLATCNLCSEEMFQSLCSLLVESGRLLSFVSLFFLPWGRGAYFLILHVCSNNKQFYFASVLKQCWRAQKTHPGKLVASVEGTDGPCGILANGIWIKHHADSHFAPLPLPEFYREKPLIVIGCVSWAVHYYCVNFVIQLEAAAWPVSFKFAQEL